MVSEARIVSVQKARQSIDLKKISIFLFVLFAYVQRNFLKQNIIIRSIPVLIFK